MKKWILLLFLMQPSLLFAVEGGVTIGNGGDATAPHSLTYLEFDILSQQSRSVLVSLINKMDLLASSPSFNSDNPPYYTKLFATRGTLAKMLATANLNVYSDKNCLNLDGTDRDASATLSPTPQICLSYLRLQKKINSSDAFVRLGGLLAHEFSHLSGTTEDEAVDFQNIVESELKQVSSGQWDKFKFHSDGSIDYLRFLYAASLVSEVAAKDWKTSCDDTKSADSVFTGLISPMSNFSRLNSETYVEFAANYLRHKLVQRYVCAKAGITVEDMDAAALELIFGQESGVYFDEASTDGLVLLGIVFDMPKPHTLISIIDSDEILEKTVAAIAASF